MHTSTTRLHRHTRKKPHRRKRAEEKEPDLSVALLRSLSGQTIVERAGHQAALERPERRPNVQKDSELDQFVDDPENPRVLPGQHRHLRRHSEQHINQQFEQCNRLSKCGSSEDVLG